MIRLLNHAISKKRISLSSWCPRYASNCHIYLVAVNRSHRKPKPTPAASTSTSSTSPASAPPPPKAEEPTPAPVTPVPAATTATPTAVPAAPPAPTPEAPPTEAPPLEAPALGSSFLSGEALQTTIRNMEEMGFPRDQVLRALRASYNNPDRAVEYLFNVCINMMRTNQGLIRLCLPIGHPCSLRGRNGTCPHPTGPCQCTCTCVYPRRCSCTPSTFYSPEFVPGPRCSDHILFFCHLIFRLLQLAQQQQQQHQQPTGTPGLGAAPAAPGLDALLSDPRFNALRELASQNPALLQPVIQQLAQSNPQLAQVLQSNPEALLDILGGGGGGGEGSHVLDVTPEEHAAIQRVGFFPS